ncbi:probable acetyltransferase [Fulvimarina pelagi HTCC2506]|uniref:Probable acetyltransferase n=3 Tax=Fulvimarina pelagi TaxID=217511 RepID=Q0G005_9HYPH|nr:probable acetyltransferase [Fulvimarina pelagi HTCC2506]BAT31466.1 probable acetyltransferase [Fulvimarina pelagi]
MNDLETRTNLVRPFTEPSVAKRFAYSPVYFGFALIDADGADGGIAGQLYWDWMVIENISVPARWRGLGLGKALIETAETQAREAECVGAWVSTYSFQSPGFYLSMGYSIFGRLPSYPGNQERLFLSKLFG